MALKFVIDALVEVPGPMRDLYKPTADGKFSLDITDHPDTAKVKEFREHNIGLTKLKEKWGDLDPVAVKAKLDAFGDLDPVAAKAAIAKLAAGDGEDVVALKLALATEKGRAASAQAKADRGVLREALRDKLLAAGVLPAALDIALDKAEPVFTLTGDVLVAKAGGPASVDEWILSATSDFAFLFAPSRGGSASPKASVLGAHSNAHVLKNPSANDLGKFASEIASGRMRVENS